MRFYEVKISSKELIRGGKKMAKKMKGLVILGAVTTLILVMGTVLFAAQAENVALSATATVSSFFGETMNAQTAIDGITEKFAEGEWASSGEVKPWIELKWDSSVTINKIVIYDRNNTLDNANGGLITFSDGSTLEISDIDPNGKATEYVFDTKTVTSLKFEINGAGSNVGLSEIEVYSVASEEAPKTSDAGLLTFVLLGASSVVGLVVIRKKATQN